MTPDERELIRSNLHQADLLLRSINHKAKAMVERGEEMQRQILAIEELKKPIYQLLDSKGESPCQT